MPQRVVLVLPPSEEAPEVRPGVELVARAARELGVAPEELAEVRPARISFDARPRERVWRVALDVWRRGEPVPPAPSADPPTYGPPAPEAPHAVVVGSGPAGLFAAKELLASGWRVTVLERGRDVRTRRRPIAELNRGAPADPDCNYCFGEGGAGTYSDGKLYTRAGSREEVRGVLEHLVAHGAPPEILVSWRPHVGSNRLPVVVVALRETVLRSGGSVRFGARAEEIEVEPGARGRPRVRAVQVRELDTGERERVACDAVLLATGHSALDALAMAARAGARLEAKGFAMGVRIEHPQPWLDERQYGGLRGAADLPASFYELAAQSGGRGVYSFCMCPGGFVVPATVSPERVVVNGMSLSRRDSPFANAGLVVAIEPEDWCGGRGVAWGWLELLRAAGTMPDGWDGRLPDRPEQDAVFGVRLQIALETVAARAGGGENRAPAQRADLFLEGRGRTAEVLRTSYRPGVASVDLAHILPRGMARRMRRALPRFDDSLSGFASSLGQLIGVESRTSSPVRIARDPDTLESREVEGLYPCGEGAGYAGGIVSAALDGRRVARALASRA